MTYDLNRGGDRSTEPADDDVIVGIPASGAPYTTSWSRVKGWIRRALSSTTPVNTSTASAGTSDNVAREDHDHGIVIPTVPAPSGTAPGNTPGSASAGTSALFSRGDHDHGITPGTGGGSGPWSDAGALIDDIDDDTGGDIAFSREGSGSTANLRGTIRDGSVSRAMITNKSVNTAKLADDAVTNSKMADAAVDTDQLADDAVTKDKLADNSVGTNKISNGAVTQAKIKSGGVGLSRLDSALQTTLGRVPSASPGNNKVWKTDGSGSPGWREDATSSGGSGEENVQSDWEVTDTTSDAFIKNKPTLPTEFGDLLVLADADAVNALADTKVNADANLLGKLIYVISGNGRIANVYPNAGDFVRYLGWVGTHDAPLFEKVRDFSVVAAHTPDSDDRELAGLDIGGIDYEIVDDEARERLHEVEQRVHPIVETDRTWADVTDSAVAGWSAPSVLLTSLASIAGLTYSNTDVAGNVDRFVYVRIPAGEKQSDYRFQYTIGGGQQAGETHNRVLGTWSGEKVAVDSNWQYFSISFYEGSTFSAGKVQLGTGEYEWDAAVTKKAVYDQVSEIVKAGSNVTAVNSDSAETVTLSSSGGGGGGASAFSELTGQIAASQIPDDVIATAKVADDAIIRAKIGSAAVGTTEIGTSAVTTVKIADASVTGAKIAVNTITDTNLEAGLLDPKIPQWVTRTAYDKGDLVWVDVSGRTEVFVCIQPVTAGTTSPPQALATHWLELDQYNGEWIAGAAWPKGHIVDHVTGSGQSAIRYWYIAQEAVTSSDPAPDDASNTKWLRFGGGRLELSDDTPVNTSTASAGTSDEVSRSDHDHGITGGSGGSAVVANPQTIAPVESEITLGTVNSVVPDGETELVPLSSLGSGTLASALSTSADTFTLKGGSYLITLHLDNIQNTTSSSNDLQYRSTLAFDVTKSGGLPAGSLCEPLPLYFRGGNASNRGEQVLRLALYLPSDTTDLQFRLIEWASNNPTRDYGYNATPREIVIFPIGGIKGDKGEPGSGGGASSFSELTGQIAGSQIPSGVVTGAKLADDAVTRAKIGSAAVGATELGTSAVTTAKIADDAVTTAKIADDAITAAKIADGVIPSGGGSEVYGSNTIRKDDQDHLHLRSPNLHLGMWGRPAEDSVAPVNTDDTSLAVPVRLTEVRSNDARSTAKLSDVLYTASGPQGNPEVEGTIKVLHSSATAIEEFGSGTGYDATKPGWIWDQTNGRFHHNGVAASAANSGSTTNKFKLRVEVDYKHHAAIGTSHMSLKLGVGVPTKFGSDLTHSWRDVDLSFFDGQTRTLSYTGDIQASSAPATTDYLTVTLESIQSTSQVLFVEAVRIHFILPDSANVNYLQEYDLNNAVTWVGRNVLGPALGSHTNNQSVAGVKIVGGRMVATEDLAVLQLISNARTGVAGNGHNIRLMTRVPGLQAPTVLHEWDDSTNVWRVVQTLKGVVKDQEVWVEADSGATYSSVGSPNFVWDSSRHDSDVVDTLLYPGLIRILTQAQYDGLSWVNPYQIYYIEA